MNNDHTTDWVVLARETLKKAAEMHDPQVRKALVQLAACYGSLARILDRYKQARDVH
jgi:hypothetical protein